MRYHDFSNPDSELINSTLILELHYDLIDNSFNNNNVFTDNIKAYIDEVADIYIEKKLLVIISSKLFAYSRVKR